MSPRDRAWGGPWGGPSPCPMARAAAGPPGPPGPQRAATGPPALAAAQLPGPGAPDYDPGPRPEDAVEDGRDQHVAVGGSECKCQCETEAGRTSRSRFECCADGEAEGPEPCHLPPCGAGAVRCGWRRRRRRWRQRRPPECQCCSASASVSEQVLWWLCVLVLGVRRVGRPHPAAASSSSFMSSTKTALFGILLLLLLQAGSTSANTGSIVSPELVQNQAESKEFICQSVDIRNNVDNFKKLENCTVVEGFVHIVLIDNARAENYTDISFPKLREIHGYLFLYRVSGLQTLAKLFPNLTVIRGFELVMNYALVIYEMQNLNEIGLISLTSIMRGSVRIEKNPVLCYVDTIDWSYISHAGEEHFIKNNKAIHECPRKCKEVCPEPNLSASKNSGPKPTPRLCWNNTMCQKVCDPKCDKSGCLDGTYDKCCDKHCLGGCHGLTRKDCYACKNFRFMDACVSNCPANNYKFLDRRCVTEIHCRQMEAPKDKKEESNIPEHPWKPFNNSGLGSGSCLLECPPGYSEKRIPKGVIDGVNETFNCEKCNGTCEKECQAENVDNIAAAQRLRGCTVITNSLEIQIRGGRNLVKELEESLEAIREIRGYLKIVRSFPLVSLNFLKNLKVIHGEKLESKKYALIVFDNQNLQKLWEWSANSTFQIKRGKILIHFNPKLCRQEIDGLIRKSGVEGVEEQDISSNGDKVACNMSLLNVWVAKVTDVAAIIVWVPFTTKDPRNLLGYVVYKTAAPNRNVTLYDSRDACGGDGWTVDDVSASDPDPNATPDTREPPNVTHIFTNLLPYTQYAFYVRTYTLARLHSPPKGETSGDGSVADEGPSGAQSKITYFRTLPGIPSPPREIETLSNSSSEIVIRWRPSYPPNGNVTKYIVLGVMEEEKPDRSNYCEDYLPPKDHTIDTPVYPIPKTTQAPPGDERNADGETCSCSKEDPDAKRREKESEAENTSNFEDLVHNMIYIRRPSSVSSSRQEKRKRRTPANAISDEAYYRYKRAVGQESRFPDNADDVIRSNIPIKNVDIRDNCTNSVCYSLKREVHGTSFVMKNLHHYSRYAIKVLACRELDPQEKPDAQNCSPEAIINQRTLPKLSADAITSSWIEETNGTFIFHWKPPPDPNGIIVKYDIKVQSESVDTGAPMLHCLSRDRTDFKVEKLSPGNYSIRISATSLFGPGNFTEKKFFIVAEPSASGTQTVVYVFIGLLFFCLAVGVVGFYAKKTWCPSQVPSVKLITNVNPDYHSATYVADEWEVPRENIQIIRELGQGSFGMVYEGIVRNCPRTGIPEQPCAIKTVNEHAKERERVEFLNEASVMKAFKTHHVVRLLGVVSVGQPTYVVMELMPRGDLKSYLRKHRPDESDDPNVQPPTLKQILRMSIEIADGMAYLAAKKFVHRDLAARNCMIAEDMTVKIGDFGMTRDIYETEYYRKGSKGLMPVRWMAPESLKDGVFTSSSDVWSYGVVLWEMATLASQPYQGLANEQVLRYVLGGGVMEAPENCPEQLYDLMRRCWQFRAAKRPSFLQLVELLLPVTETMPSFNARSFFHSPEAAELMSPQESGRAPLEEGELDLEAISPTTPLRSPVRDLEDFDIGESESETEQPEQSGMPAPAPSSYAQYHKACSSDSSRESKASNGSSSNANTANGFIHDHWHRHGNGATSHPSHPPHSSHHGPPPTLKTTEC